MSLLSLLINILNPAANLNISQQLVLVCYKAYISHVNWNKGDGQKVQWISAASEIKPSLQTQETLY